MDESVIYMGEAQSQCVNTRNVNGTFDQVETQGQNDRSRESVIYLGPVDSDSSNSRQVKKKEKSLRQNKENLKPVTVVDLTKDSPVQKPLGADNMPDSASILKDINKDKNDYHPKLDCPICLESLVNLRVRVTRCGHVFCAGCLNRIFLEDVAQCPKCRRTILRKHVGPIYFT